MTRWHLSTILFAATCAAASTTVHAQGHSHAPAAAPPAQLGRVVFPTSCASSAAALVERGVALLHSFWYEEAASTFSDALHADGSCAAALWGRAMSRLHPLWQPPSSAEIRASREDLRLAAAAAPPGTREQAWVVALAAYFEGPGERAHRERVLAWEQATQRVHEADPADAEAAIFHALALISAAQALPKDSALRRERRAGSLLVELFREQPDHPGLAHYIIHAYDTPALAADALEAARRYAQIAPAVPHARHMPSHTFTRLGLWEESARSNRSAAAAGRAYELRRHASAAWDQRLHALDYLVYAELQLGRVHVAASVVEELMAVTTTEPASSLAAEYALSAAPARLALETGDWDAAARLRVRPSPEFPATEAITRFARALGAARSGQTAGAEAELTALDAIEQRLATLDQAYWRQVVSAMRQAAAAWLSLARGNEVEAVRLAIAAADDEDALEKHPVTPAPVAPARELLGELLLETGNAAGALAAFEASLRRERGRARSLAGAARARLALSS